MKDDENKKVEGAEKTLKLSVKFGSQTRDVPLDAAFSDPATMLPTSRQPGLATISSISPARSAIQR